eukprot:499468-Prymnesium_polylepis.1
MSGGVNSIDVSTVGCDATQPSSCHRRWIDHQCRRHESLPERLHNLQADGLAQMRVQPDNVCGAH